MKINARFIAALALWIFAIATGSELFPIILTFPTFVIAAWRLSCAKTKEFTAHDMLWLTVLFFFVVSPIQSINSNGFLGGTTSGVMYEDADFLAAQVIVTISVSILAMFDGRRNSGVIIGREQLGRDQVIMVLIICIFSFLAFIYFSGGLATVLLPRREKSREDVFILRLGFLAMLAVGTMLLAANKKKLYSIASLCACGLMLLVCVNPLNSPRFFFLASWFPVAIILFRNNLKFVMVFAAIIFGILVYMPIASLTSRRGLEGLALLKDSQYANDILRLKDMDVFDTLVHACSMMHQGGFMFGKNIAAIIFFFIPRSIWPDKPIVGGLIVGDDLYYNWYAGTHNLSFFVGGDLYMDFGYIGVAFGFIIIGMLWKKSVNAKLLCLNRVSVFSCILMGSIPILLRGPLGAVIGYFFCLLMACLIYGNLVKVNFSSDYKVEKAQGVRAIRG